MFAQQLKERSSKFKSTALHPLSFPEMLTNRHFAQNRKDRESVQRDKDRK